MKRALIAAALALCVAGTAAAKPSLEERVQRLEDAAEINRILILYGQYLDGRDYAGYAGLFAKNGEWVGGFGRVKGQAAITAMLEQQLGKAEPGYVNKQSYHLLSNPIVTVDGDTAHATSKYLFMVRSPENRPVAALAGRYVDDFVRENGQWKILKRVTHGAIPWRDGNDPTPGPPPQMPPMGKDR